MKFVDRAGIAQPVRDALVVQLQGFSSLQDVVRWGFAQQPPRDVHAVIVQDEFTHDVVVPWEAGYYLAFDTT